MKKLVFVFCLVGLCLFGISAKSNYKAVIVNDTSRFVEFQKDVESIDPDCMFSKKTKCKIVNILWFDNFITAEAYVGPGKTRMPVGWERDDFLHYFSDDQFWNAIIRHYPYEKNCCVGLVSHGNKGEVYFELYELTQCYGRWAYWQCLINPEIVRAYGYVEFSSMKDAFAEIAKNTIDLMKYFDMVVYDSFSEKAEKK